MTDRVRVLLACHPEPTPGPVSDLLYNGRRTDLSARHCRTSLTPLSRQSAGHPHSPSLYRHLRSGRRDRIVATFQSACVLPGSKMALRTGGKGTTSHILWRPQFRW